MHDQPLTTAEQPAFDLRQQQINLENWCRNIGADRVLSPGWEKGAASCLATRVAGIYLRKVKDLQATGKARAGKYAHVWALMHNDVAVNHVAIESLLYVLTSTTEDRPYNQLSGLLGRRAEYVLWLTHPSWGRSQHLKALQLASNNDLGMELIIKRLQDQGFRKAANYQPLTRLERTAIGAFFLECIIESTRMIEVWVKSTPRGKVRMVRPTTLFWDFQGRWRDAAKLFRPLRLPMLVPPRPWLAFDSGGYLTSVVPISTVGWERWPEVSRRIDRSVVGAINALQEVPHTIDRQQLAVEQAVWELGHPIGSLPPRTRIEEPIDAWYKEQGLGPSAYWKAVWKWRADRRRNGARSSFVNAVISCERLAEARDLFWVWTMDHRGRLYAKSAQLNPSGPDHMRSLLQFSERSPVKGHTESFAWSIAGAYGIAADPVKRRQYLTDQSELLARCGEDPLANLGYIETAASPWRFTQLCRDWHGYRMDPGYTSGTIHWLDQTCSGWGHVACLTGDAELARFANCTGHQRSDLYAALGQLVVQRLDWMATQPPKNELEGKCIDWWCNHQIPRSLWKRVLMPVIYGRSYLSLAETISLYLRDEIEDFLTDMGIPVLGLARVLASTTHRVISEALPNIQELRRWMLALANLQMDAGQKPHWLTPNGLLVECWASDTERQALTLRLSGRSLRIDMREYTGKGLKRTGIQNRLVPDFVHSYDAAFLQRFVVAWRSQQLPLTTVHDCFGTTLEHMGRMREELLDEWFDFYSVDHLAKHQAMVAAETGQEAPAPPMVGTLDRSHIAENPALFC